MIQYYNPDNDLALAAGYANYTPPMAAQRLRQAGALLPMWYGKPGDKVLCFGVNARWWDDMVASFHLATDIWDHQCDSAPSPWGWSLPVRNYFRDLGFTSGLPSDEAIRKIRELSHRRTAAELGRALKDSFPSLTLTEPAVEAHDLSEVEKAIARFGGQAMIKFPWSSSGRGLASTRLMGMDKTLRMAQESISKQGSVLVEPLHEPALNFALLYETRGGRALQLGTSVFDTDERGIYVGNMVAHESDRRKRVGECMDLDILDEVDRFILDWLIEHVAAYYEGILGVDMLITADGGLDPCVELNLRKTMGYVANRFAEECLASGARGTLRVIHGESHGAEPIIENSRLAGGALALTPPNPHFTFLVTID